MTLVSTCAISVSPPKSDIQFHESLCSGLTRLNTFTSYPFCLYSSAVSPYNSPFGSVITTDSFFFKAWNNAFRITALDFIVPDAPKTAMCRLSLVSLGIHTALPSSSPRITPSASSIAATSRFSLISCLVIHDAVPYAPDLLLANPRGSVSLLSNLSCNFTRAKISPPTSAIENNPFSPSGEKAFPMHTNGFQFTGSTTVPPTTPPALFQSA